MKKKQTPWRKPIFTAAFFLLPISILLLLCRWSQFVSRVASSTTTTRSSIHEKTATNDQFAGRTLAHKRLSEFDPYSSSFRMFDSSLLNWEQQEHDPSTTTYYNQSLLYSVDVPPLIQPALGPAMATSSRNPNQDDTLLLPWDTDWRHQGNILQVNHTLRARRMVYVITPTYARPTQQVDLMRLQQTLQLAILRGVHTRLYWIVVEDAKQCSQNIRNMLLYPHHRHHHHHHHYHHIGNSLPNIPFAHIAIPTPGFLKRTIRRKGVRQRNAALDIIVHQLGCEGVVYFADDDNAYDVQLFAELAYVTSVGVMGVGLVGSSAYERCVVSPQTGQVEALLTNWNPSPLPRQYPVDMAGFAVATIHLREEPFTNNDNTNQQQDSPQHAAAAAAATSKKPLRFQAMSRPGYLESDFLQQIIGDNSISMGLLEPLAGNCTRILAWHVKTVPKIYGTTMDG